MRFELGFAALAFVGLTLAGCGKKDDDSSAPVNPNGFVNAASEEQFFEKGDAFRSSISDGSTRLTLTGSQPDPRAFGDFSLGALSSFVNLGSSGNTARPQPTTSGDSERCSLFKAEETTTSALTSETSSAPIDEGELRIRENDSCASAVKSVKANFTAMLNMLPKQIEGLRNAETRLAGCGIKVRRLEPNPSMEAVGYEFTPETVDPRADYAIVARGAANGDELGFFLNLRLRGDIQDDDGDHLTFNLSGDINSFGYLATNAFKANASLGGSLATSQGSVNGNLTSSIFASGLGANQLAQILETQSVKATAQSADGRSGAIDASATIKLQEISATELRIQGEVVADNQRQSFDMTLTKDQAGNCKVRTVSQTKTAL